MSTDRVVISGAGWVTPLGSDIDGVWQRLLAGEGSIGAIEHFDASTFATRFASQVRDFQLEDFLGERAGRHARSSRATRMALAAANRAWTSAGLGPLEAPEGESQRSPHVDPRRFGMYLGSGEGRMDLDNFARTCVESWSDEDRRLDYEHWAEAAAQYLDVVAELEQEPSMCLAHMAAEFGCRGPVSNCMTACAAGTQAVGEAFEIIRRGDADVMLAGGAHSMIHPLGMTGFIRLTALSTRNDEPETASRPFDATREGFVMGEGAGIVVVESLEHALNRGVTPLAEIVGFGSGADAYRITDIQPEGLGGAAAMSRALEQAGIDPSATDESGRPLVHWVNAHGTGTKENDAIETMAVKHVFGELASKVPFSSVKSVLGHLIQAAGAVELITCVQAIQTGIIPATMNLNTPDPKCDLDHVANEPRDCRAVGGVDVCLSNSFGFGGQNNSICIKRFSA
ncbi:MAG TPA: beta-ketoacyl-[acyl-carrier-protein] synthase family protein [Phycisphaerales bacterium]|nr:beta-ketoacyl-[acyl-carrier-protein] synthase family protein [Phycisphaerales bacterium]